MSDTAIRVENLGNRYQLGGQKSAISIGGSFRESLTGLFRRKGTLSFQARRGMER